MNEAGGRGRAARPRLAVATRASIASAAAGGVGLARAASWLLGCRAGRSRLDLGIWLHGCPRSRIDRRRLLLADRRLLLADRRVCRLADWRTSGRRQGGRCTIVAPTTKLSTVAERRQRASAVVRHLVHLDALGSIGGGPDWRTARRRVANVGGPAQPPRRAHCVARTWLLPRRHQAIILRQLRGPEGQARDLREIR